MSDHHEDVTEVEPFNDARLRAALEHVLSDLTPEGSLFLRALACCYLSAPAESEPVLDREFHAQAARESADPDELLLRLVGIALGVGGDA